MKKNKLAIFICAHKPIENEIPKGKEYIIVAQNDSIKDNEHEVIYLTKDKFTQKHWRCYGEGCAIRYLWKHPDILPDYVGIAHYRRFFTQIIGEEQYVPSSVNRCGAIIMNPFVHNTTIRYNNWTVQCADHFEEDALALREVVKDVNPDFSLYYEAMLSDNKQYGCNMFIMKKEHFLEMCDICFAILDEFDKRMKYTDNDAVYKEIMRRHRRQRILGGIEWQARLQGFYLEWLTDTYYRYKFNINKCLKYNLGIPNSDITYENYTYYR